MLSCILFNYIPYWSFTNILLVICYILYLHKIIIMHKQYKLINQLILNKRSSNLWLILSDFKEYFSTFYYLKYRKMEKDNVYLLFKYIFIV